MYVDNKGDISKNILLNAKVDTLERVDAMFNDFNNGQVRNVEDIVPKNLSGDDMLDFGKINSHLDDIYKLLNSDDERKRQLGKEYLNRRDSLNPALTKGLGLKNMVRYQEGQEKFTGGESFINNNGKYGFDPYKTLAENEDYYKRHVWDNYSLVGKIWRGVGTFAGRALSKLTTGLVGTVGDIGAMAWNGLQELTDVTGVTDGKNEFWADVSDNFLARKMEELDHSIKQNILPTYRVLNYDDKGVFSKLRDPYFWQNDIADGAGFLMQFMIPGVAIGKLANLGKVGKLGKFGKIMSTEIGGLSSSSKAARLGGNTVELLTGSKDGFGIAAHAFNTTMESVAETKEGFKATVDDLMAKGATREEARRIAAENAPAQFGMNMGILTFSNALENRWFQQIAKKMPLKRYTVGDDLSLTKEAAKSKFGRFLQNDDIVDTLAFYGNKTFKGIAMEGFWEENAQLAAQRTVRDSYTRRGDDTIGLDGKIEKSENFFKQFIKQTSDALRGRDREAADSITAGAVIGIVAGAGIPKVFGGREIVKDSDGKLVDQMKLFKGERRQRKEDEIDAILRIKNTRDAFLDISKMPNDLYDVVDGEIVANEEKFKLRAEEINQKLSKISSVFKRSVTAEDLMDGRRRERIQSQLFADYLKANILNGTGDIFLDRLDKWGEKNPKELELYGVTPDMNLDPKKWGAIGRNLYNSYKKLDRIPYQSGNLTIDQYNTTVQSIKSRIFDYISAVEFAKSAIPDMDSSISELELSDSYSQYNKLLLDKKILEFFGEESDKAKIEEIDKEIQNRLDLFTQSGEQFEKDKDGIILPPGVDENEYSDNLGLYIQFSSQKYGEELGIKNAEEVIKRYSDPVNGLDEYRKFVDESNEFAKKGMDKAVIDLGYNPENMTEEEKAEIISEGKVNPNAPLDANGKPINTVNKPDEVSVSDEVIEKSSKFVLNNLPNSQTFLTKVKKFLEEQGPIKDILNNGKFKVAIIEGIKDDLGYAKSINSLYQDVLGENLIDENAIIKRKEDLVKKEQEKKEDVKEANDKSKEAREVLKQFRNNTKEYFDNLHEEIETLPIEDLRNKLLNSLC